MLSATCPACGRSGRVPEESQGKKVKCPGCGEKFIVEAPESEDWYYQELGQVKGPVSWTMLRFLAKQDEIGSETMVRRAVDKEWMLAINVSGLEVVSRIPENEFNCSTCGITYFRSQDTFVCPKCNKLLVAEAKPNTGITPLASKPPSSRELPQKPSNGLSELEGLAHGETIPRNLRPCPDCNREVSRRAVSCPHCGCPLAPNSTPAKDRVDESVAVRPPPSGVAPLFGILLVGIGIVFLIAAFVVNLNINKENERLSRIDDAKYQFGVHLTDLVGSYNYPKYEESKKEDRTPVYVLSILGVICIGLGFVCLTTGQSSGPPQIKYRMDKASNDKRVIIPPSLP